MLAHGATQVSVRRQRGVRDDLPHNPQDSGAPLWLRAVLH